MNTHEIYVSLEIAKLLKEVGFDWECREYYPSSFMACRYEEYAKPTLAVAQKWLREVKGYYIAWEFNMNISSLGLELYDFADISVYIFVDSEQGNICKCKLKENYKIVEEAQEAGIKKVLELILEKGEYNY